MTGAVPGRSLRLLFVKHDLDYPRSRGHDIRGYNMMRALAQLGHRIGLLTVEQPSTRALEGLRLEWQATLAAMAPEPQPKIKLPYLQAGYASYFGVTKERMLAVAGAANQFAADAIIGMGPDMPPYMAATTVARVWYVGDEWVSHYSSLVKAGRMATWGNLKTAAVWGLYERVFAPALSRIWVVSDREARHMRRWAACDRVDALPNGVDSDYFAPMELSERPNTAVFWGRLDFAPNLQALQWFCGNVWPVLRRRYPNAEFRIIGFNAGPEVRALAQAPGVCLSPDLDDVRGMVGEHAVAVMPFNSGGGVKNKLLEAASMGKAVVCSPLSCNGLRGEPALVVAPFTGDSWVEAISRLWDDSDARARLGLRAREWAVREHSWTRTAEDALQALRPSLATARLDGRESPRHVTVLRPQGVDATAPRGSDSKGIGSAPAARLRLLFVARALGYPRSLGHDICGYNMMRALAQLGHHVGLVTVEEPIAEALEGLQLEWRSTLDTISPLSDWRPTLSPLQESYASYFGVTRKSMKAVASAASLFDADAVIGIGPDIPAYMAATSVARVWYVGDEWVSHYSSLVKPGRMSTWGHLKSAAVWGLYERTYARTLDRIWVVSDREARNMRRYASTNRVDAMPNGVDSTYFAPTGIPERPNSAVFWGRLDFAPNQQALYWFCGKVWPELRRRHPDAEFRIIGFSPGDDVRALAQAPGVTLSADLADVRGVVSESAIAVMPFNSGGGIKNKLLEAASMGKALVCSPFACHGLRGKPPLVVTPFNGEAWVSAIEDLWAHPAERTRLGQQAREWAVREHSWTRTAEDALLALGPKVSGKTGSGRLVATRHVTVSR
jgi:glycosyltransferase involved in cell wall biosynthesis